MYKIKTLNKIDQAGLSRLPENKYQIADNEENPDAIIVRSFKMHGTPLADNLKAIARAGAGVNNIPLEECTQKGIVVFNTPGANANAVKELVIAALLISSRGVPESISWAQTLANSEEDVASRIEAGKKNFAGTEIKGKTLAVIGLGAIGILIANACAQLGMDVIGYDPFLSVPQALKLNSSVKVVDKLDTLLSDADFVTINIPQNEKTKGFVNADLIELMKDGVKVLNFARGGLVNNADMSLALETGKVARYITDFPDKEVLAMKNVMPIAHLGASTAESETNCAVMAANQVRDYLENGNIVNSVNFPQATMERHGGPRFLIMNRNVPNMVGQISTLLASEQLNIEGMLNKNNKELAYTIIDIDRQPSDSLISQIKNLEGVMYMRLLEA